MSEDLPNASYKTVICAWVGAAGGIGAAERVAAQNTTSRNDAEQGIRPASQLILSSSRAPKSRLKRLLWCELESDYTPAETVGQVRGSSNGGSPQRQKPGIPAK